jgi:hypothetical protein
VLVKWKTPVSFWLYVFEPIEIVIVGGGVVGVLYATTVNVCCSLPLLNVAFHVHVPRLASMGRWNIMPHV